MIFLYGLLLGLLQGLTEFLPVSSSGHFALIYRALKLPEDASLFFDLILHLGSFGGVFLVYSKDISRMTKELLSMLGIGGKNLKTIVTNTTRGVDESLDRLASSQYKKFTLLLVVSSVFTGLGGFIFAFAAKNSFSSFLAIGIGFLITAIMLLIVNFLPRGGKKPKEASLVEAALIGFLQGLTIFPGISRLAVVLVLCLFFGYGRKFSIKYAILLSLPSILGACIYQLFFLPFTIPSWQFVLAGVLGGLLAWLVSSLTIRWMIRRFMRGSFYLFALYSLLLGIFSWIIHFS